MVKVMTGFRVLELAQFTFVPAAGAILADWGADVIKVEHPARGDTQRGFLNMGGIQIDPERHPLMEHPNRGKRSVGIDVSTPGGQEVIYELAKSADVFLTNYKPAQRQKHKFDVEHIRAANPDIVYARGSAYGDKGAERDTGGYDGTAFWTRSGIGYALTPEELGGALGQGIPAFGDSIGGMFIAGGISAALLHRQRTGEAVELDVSLLSTAWWAAGASVRAFDPEAADETRRIYGDRADLVLCEHPYDALDGADALAILTAWKAFRSPDFARIRSALATPVIFDGRNLYDPAAVEEAGLAYYGIGRGRSLARS